MSKGKYKQAHLALLEAIQQEYELSKRIYDELHDDAYLGRMAVIDTIMFQFQEKMKEFE